MDIKELRKMTVPKLRELAKEATDLQGVGGMEKEALIEAIAKAKGISYEEPPKDVSTISSVKEEIRNLRKQKEELLASANRDRIKLHKIHNKTKKLKRLTRQLAKVPKEAVPETPQAAPQPSAPAEGAAPPPPEQAG